MASAEPHQHAEGHERGDDSGEQTGDTASPMGQQQTDGSRRCRFCFQLQAASTLLAHPMAEQIGLPPSPCMCATCHDIYTADRWKWKVNDQGKDQFCRMCGEGDLGSVTCDRDGCKFMFCEGCILANCGKRSFEQITAQADGNCWHCFVCTHAGPSASSPSAPLNRIRRHLHLSARAAAGGFTKRTIFNCYEIRRRVRGFTYFDRDRLDQLRHGSRAGKCAGGATATAMATATVDGDADACMEDVAASSAASTAAASSAAVQVAAAPTSSASGSSLRHRSSGSNKQQRTPPRTGRAASATAAPAAVLGAGSLAAGSLPCDIPDKPCSRTGFACDSELDEEGDSDEDIDEDELGLEWDASAAASAPSPSAAAAAAASPALSSTPPLKKLIVFSFFLHELHAASSHTPYVVGLLENLRRVWSEWPGWTVRIYVDDSFQLPAPAEALGAPPNTDGLACKLAYHSAMRNVWYGCLGPLLRRMEARGVLVQVRRFHWPLFQDKDRIHHGLVGTLARFLALADLGREASHVVLADADNLVTPAARAIVEANQREHQRFHDPRYPIPVWAGGFSARVPPHALQTCAASGAGRALFRLDPSAGWTNPYARIERWLHRWAVEHCRDPEAIHQRPEMFRVDRGGNCTVSAERAEADGRRRAKELALQDQERMRDREEGLAQLAASPRRRDEGPPRQMGADEHKAPTAPARPSNASSSVSPRLSAAVAPPSGARESGSKSRQEHKEQRRPRSGDSNGSDGGSCEVTGLLPRSNSRSTDPGADAHATPDTPASASTPTPTPAPSSQEKRRSSRGHVSLAREKEEEMMGTAAGASSSGGGTVPAAASAAAAASTMIDVDSDAAAADTDTDVPPLLPLDSAAAASPGGDAADEEAEQPQSATPLSAAPAPEATTETAAADDDDECVEIARPPSNGQKGSDDSSAHAAASAASATRTKQRQNRSRKTPTARGPQRARRGTPGASGEGASASASASSASGASSSSPFSLPADRDSGEESLLIFFPYGCDQVFLADYVWPHMQHSCETTYALLPTEQLRKELKVWPPRLTPEEARRVVSAPRYWTIMDWLPHSAACPSPPTRIEAVVKKHIVSKWAAMLSQMGLDRHAYDPPQPGLGMGTGAGAGMAVRYVAAAELERRVKCGEVQVPVPFASSSSNPQAQIVSRPRVKGAAGASAAAHATTAAAVASRSDAIVLDDDADDSMGEGGGDDDANHDADADADAASTSSGRSGAGARGRAAAAAAVPRSTNGRWRASGTSTSAAADRRKVSATPSSGAAAAVASTGTPPLPPRVLPPRSARRSLSLAQLGDDGDADEMLDMAMDMDADMANELFAQAQGDNGSAPASPRAPRPPLVVPEVVRLSDSPVPDADAISTGIYAYDEEAPSGASSAAEEDEDEPLVMLATTTVPKPAAVAATGGKARRPTSPPPSASPTKRAKVGVHATSTASSAVAAQSEPAPAPPVRKAARVRKALVVSEGAATLVPLSPAPSAPAPAPPARTASSSAAAARAPAARSHAPSAAHSAHFTDECEWGCRRLHDAATCQTPVALPGPNSAPPLICANHAALLETSSGAFRVHLARGHDSTAAVEEGECSAPMDVAQPLEESKTDHAAAAVAPVHSSRPASPEPAGEPGGAPVRGRSARTKKVAERLGGFVVAHPRRVAASSGDATSGGKQPRVPCACACDFCAPPPFRPSEPGVHPPSSDAPRHPSLPSRAWPWDLEGLVEWLASLQLESLIPLQVLLNEEPLAVAKLLQTSSSGVRPGVMQLLVAHPTRLLRLLNAASRDYGASSDSVPELLAWSLFQKLQALAHTMRQQQTSKQATQS